ncbi:MAG: hypothetical protein KBC46_07165 [Ferrovibrio sp.]|nr:hypothetical protein [Ferrovibrio sp.]
MPSPARASQAKNQGGRLAIFRQPILWLTLLYLAFELGFSARLLDVSSGTVSPEMLKDVERIGRSLSGLALALALLPLLLNRADLSWRAKLGGALLLTALCIGGMFWFQSWLVRELTEELDARDRRNAVFLSLAAVALSNGEMRVARLDLGPEGSGSPSAKAFVAAFPALALTKPDLEQDALNVMRQLLRRRITEACEPGTPGCFGTAADFHDMVWLPLYLRVVESYARYSDGAQAYHAARRLIPERQEAAWREYLASRKIRQGSAAERAAIDLAVRNRVEQEADHAAQSIMRDSFGADLPLNLVRFEDFFRHPTIQARMHALLPQPFQALAASLPMLPAVADENEVQSRVFEPLLQPLIEAQMEPLLAPLADYEDEGRLGERGREAAERVIVPPVALGFSLAGGLGHLFKLGFLLLLIIFPRQQGKPAWHSGLPRAALMGSGVALLVIVTLAQPNSVVESPAYPVLHRYATERFTAAGATTIEWIIRMQAYAYPCNEAIRRHLLFDLSYGYQPV